jgi:hypothetical protein
MRPLRDLAPLPLALTCALIVVGGCGRGVALPGDPAPGSTTIAAPPSRVPAAEGVVTGQGTVIQVSDQSPELCLGPVGESFPPQCDGIRLAGWDWERAGVQDEAGDGATRTRWGTYAVTGDFDGRTLAVTDAVPLALYDVVASPSPRPVAPPRLTEDQWAAVEASVGALPGVLGVVRETPTGPVHVTVVHDDGTVADWAVAAFGPGAVLVTSALR